MSPAGTCPHPEKKRWPLLDDQEGLRCTCGHVWAPYVFVAYANVYFAGRGLPSRLEVYRCRDRVSGVLLDHWHTTDRGKRERPHDLLDAPVKDDVPSILDIQKPRWNGRRKAKPVTRTERRRLRRHRRI